MRVGLPVWPSLSSEEFAGSEAAGLVAVRDVVLQEQPSLGPPPQARSACQMLGFSAVRKVAECTFNWDFSDEQDCFVYLTYLFERESVSEGGGENLKQPRAEPNMGLDLPTMRS